METNEQKTERLHQESLDLAREFASRYTAYGKEAAADLLEAYRERRREVKASNDGDSYKGREAYNAMQGEG